MKRRARIAALGTSSFLAVAYGAARAQEAGWSGPRSLGQRLYVPVYLYGTGLRPPGAAVAWNPPCGRADRRARAYDLGPDQKR
jgi:hypothetical protein